MAGLQAGRNEKVTGAFGRRLPEDRCLDVDEAGLLHHPSNRPDHAPAKTDVALELRATEIQPAVAEAQRLVDVLLVELERQRCGTRDDSELLDLDLDLAGRQVRVDGFRSAPENGASRLKHEFVPYVMRGGVRLGRLLGVDDELAQAGAVAQVDE